VCLAACLLAENKGYGASREKRRCDVALTSKIIKSAFKTLCDYLHIPHHANRSRDAVCCVPCRARGATKSRPAAQLAPAGMARNRSQDGGARQHTAPTDRYFTTVHALAAKSLHSVIPLSSHFSIYQPKCLQCEGQQPWLLVSPSIPFR